MSSDRPLHPWGNVELSPKQRAAFNAIESLLAGQPVYAPICLIGAFGSGKTTLARYWLAQHFDDPEARYISAGRPLLDGLKQEESLGRMSGNPAKILPLLQLTLSELLEKALADETAVVLDNLEVVQPYGVSLEKAALPYTRQGKAVLLCLSSDKKANFHMNIPRAERHCFEI